MVAGQHRVLIRQQALVSFCVAPARLRSSCLQAVGSSHWLMAGVWRVVPTLHGCMACGAHTTR
eukprot:357450-Chlamydomonas_euryale.AAC.1